MEYESLPLSCPYPADFIMIIFALSTRRMLKIHQKVHKDDPVAQNILISSNRALNLEISTKWLNVFVDSDANE